MMRPALAVALFLSAGGCSRGDAESSPTDAVDRSHWKEFRSDEGGFRVRMPGVPVAGIKPLGQSAAGGAKMLTYTVERPAGTIFSVRFVEVAGEPPAAQVEAGFLAIRGRIAGEFGDRLEKFTEKQISLYGKPGREWKVRAKATATEPAIDKVMRMYVFEGRTYQLDVVRRDGEPDPVDVRMFFDSFNVPEARLEAWR